MKWPRPRGSGARDCPPEQGFFGLSKPQSRAREVHLEGAARWARFHGRSDARTERGWCRTRARRCWPRPLTGSGLTRALVARAGGDARAARPARSGPRRPRSGGDARRRRRLPVGPARGARPAAAVRAGRVGLDGVSGDRRGSPSDPGLLDALRAARARARERRVGAGRPPGADRDRHRRDADRRALREGGSGRELQGRLRVSPAAGLSGRERARRWPGCCGPATPAPTPPPTRSRSSSRRSSSSRATSSRARRPRSWCATDSRRRHARALPTSCARRRIGFSGRAST